LSETEIAAHLARVEKQGYTVVEDSVDPGLIDEIEAAVSRLEKELSVEPAGNDFEGVNTLRIYNLLALDPVFEKIPVHPAVLPVVEGVLDSGCLVSSLSSIKILPGELAQPLHADDQLIPIARPHPALVCNTMWALTEFTELNGATRIIPGSHLREDVPEYGVPLETVAAEMKRGDVLLWNGSMWHGGGRNASDGARLGVAMNYCAGYIRQQENQQLGIPRERVRDFDPRLQELVGYGIYGGLIGHINKNTPAAMFGSSWGQNIAWDR